MDCKRKIDFLKNDVPLLVLGQNDDLKGLVFIDSDLTTPAGLDGFMSVIHRLKIKLRQPHSDETKTLHTMVKMMKGSDQFRQDSLGLILFPNEVYVYGTVIPAFRSLSTEASIEFDSLNLCPRVFISEFGRYPSYSDQVETMLIMEDVARLGYTAGPKLNLDRAHLALMAKKIANFHAFSYAMRITDSERFEALVDGIIPLNFVEERKIVFKSYDTVFKIVFERLFDFLDENPEVLANSGVAAEIEALKIKYSKTPSDLMQKCLKRDDTFSVILHGDFNRNNVLFRYDHDTPVDVMLIDFQENRYGSPALDLSFFMYMNMHPDLWESYWDELLEIYHAELMRCTKAFAHLSDGDEILKKYSFSNLKRHLVQHFVYGAVIAIKFLPCMLSSDEEIAEIARHFEADVTSQAFRDICLISGGREANERLAKVIIHAAKQGFLAIVDD